MNNNLTAELHESVKLRKRLAGLILLILLLIFFSFVWTDYQTRKTLTEEKELSKLQAITTTLAGQIDAAKLEALFLEHFTADSLVGLEKDPDFLAIQHLLKSTGAQNKLETPIYILHKVEPPYPKPAGFAFGISSAGTEHYLQDFPAPPVELSQYYTTGKTIAGYEDNDGKWLAAFYPIKNEEGKTIGVVVADQKYPQFISGAHQLILPNLLFMLILLVGFAGLALVTGIKSMASSRRIRMMLQKEIRARTSELRESNARLTEKTKKLDQFVHQASHYLLGPIATLRGMCEVMRQNVKDGLALKYNELNFQTISKMDKFVKRQIEVNNLDKIPMENEWISLIDLVEDIRESCQQVLDEKHIQFMFDPERDFSVHTDRSQLTSILSNLVHNAISFSTTPDCQPHVKVYFKGNDQLLKIIVDDNGIGIDKPRVGQDVFKMFYRANQNSSGAGLGLYSLMKSLERIGGSIQYTSTLGVGSRFILTFTADNFPIKVVTPTAKSLDLKLAALVPQLFRR